MDYIIRRISISEYKELKNIRTRAVIDSPQAFGDTPEETLNRTDDVWKQWIEHAYSLVAVVSDVFVSICVLRKDEKGVWVINGVWTDPSFRNMGISRDIFKQILTEAKLMKIKRIQLHVNPLQSSAIALYRSLGFVQEGRMTREVMGDKKEHNQITLILDLVV